ncbi:MAG TPA: ATP-binding protein [Opitutus sp.]|nr:ATP-binding protein [Opitutus sp.]
MRGESVEPAERPVLTSFEQLWQLTPAEQMLRYPVRLDYVVYYCDPWWQSMWGRCGEARSYLSVGRADFPIKAGQEILIEGFLRPADGLVVEQPKITVLRDSVPLEPLAATGDVGNAKRFDRQLVTIDGYVDRQGLHDSNHLDATLLVDGRVVLMQVMLNAAATVPDWTGRFVRATGVYFNRAKGDEAPVVELWIQQKEDVVVRGTLERDPRFELVPTPLGQLAPQPGDAMVHVHGRVRARDPGVSLTIDDDTGTATLLTSQSGTPGEDREIEAIGRPAQGDGHWVLRDALIRDAQAVVTSISQIYQMPEARRDKRLRARIEYLVYFYDPDPSWRAMWGRSGGSDDYVSLGATAFPIKPGQRILIEGSMVPMAGAVIDDPKVTVLEEGVTLEAMDTAGRVGDTSAFDKHLVWIEGYVDRQTVSPDGQHVKLDLVVEGRTITGRMLVSRGTMVPNWEGARVRMKGVYSGTADPTGGPPSIEVWVAGAENLKVLGWLSEDPGFKIAARPIDGLESVPSGTVVHVVGIVRGQQPGRSLLLRDDTGQIQLRTAQARPMAVGEPVEAYGTVTRDAMAPVLGNAIFRSSRRSTDRSPGELRRLNLADQVRELAPEDAARNHPVRLTGVITWARPNADFLFVRDSSGSVRVLRPAGPAPVSLFPGRKIAVTGVSAAGRFAPIVLATGLQVEAAIELPEPQTVTLDQAMTGVEEAEWVSMSGYVRAAVKEGPWTRLDLTTSSGEFSAMLPADDRWATLPGAVVRLRGVCTAIANEKRQLTGVQLWVGSSGFVEIEEAAPANPFVVPARSIASLRQFTSMQALNRRVRVSGVVVHQDAGRLVQIQDGNEGLLVLSRDPSPLTPGDRIEAVGLPGRENSRVVLREAVFRRIAPGAEPEPVDVPVWNQVNVELDQRLVRTPGTLLDVNSHERGVELILQQGDHIFEAPLGMPRAALPRAWRPGSRLALTGVYVVEFDEYRRPKGVLLQLRSPADVQVLRQPPWWTVKRVAAMTGVIAVAALLGLLWAIVLGRRVRQQTAVIREQFENEKAARVEAALARTSKLESLGVLAGGIAHDFNNLLTVITGNLSLAKLEERLSEEAKGCLMEGERAALRARDLTQQLLTFAKGGDPVRAATRLQDVVQEAVRFALHGSKVRSEFEIAPDLWAADVDRGQIGRVAHNIIINANQAMPQGGVIRIALRNEAVGEGRAGLAPGRYVRLTFADSGAGISAENLARIFEPYFTTKKQGSGLGLATVYSIVKKHQGHVEAASVPGRGTTFDVWLPATTGESVVEQRERAPGATQPLKPGRALVMDDEAPIRLLASAVLRRMGFAVTAVEDGDRALIAYAAAREEGRPFDVVVLDLTVAGAMGGAEAMDKIRELDPDVRAVVSSGYSSDPIMANYRAHGFRGRAPKPYTAEEFSRVVSAVMQDDAT